MSDQGSGSRTVAEVMSTQLAMVTSDSTVADAARLMRDQDVGPVLVTDGDSLAGILTDRDIAIRVVAEGLDPGETRVADVASRSLATLSPQDTLDRAAEVMRTEAVRRLPVVEGGRAVGIVSLGDLAQEDESSDDAGVALTDISAAPADQ